MISSNKNAPPAEHNEKLWNPAYILMLVLGLFTSAASQMVTPNLPEYIIDMGASLTLSSTITSLMSLVAMVLRPVSGAANDILSRKNLMLFSTGLTAACLVGYSIAPTLPIIVAIRILHGVAFSVQGVSNMAFATSFIPKSRLGEGLGYLALSNMISQMLGPSIGIFLSDKFGTQYMFWAAAIITLCSMFIVLRVPYKYEKSEISGKARLKQIKLSNLIAKELLFYAFLIGMFSCGNALVSTFLKLMADERGVANIGLYFTVNSLFMVFVRPMAGKLTDRKGLAFILIPAYIIEAIAMAFIGAAGTIWLFLLAAACRAIGQGSGAPAIQASSIKKIGIERSGVAISTCYIGQDLMHVLGPIIGAAVVERTSYSTLFYGYAVVVLLVDLSYILYRKLGFEKEPAAETAEAE